MDVLLRHNVHVEGNPDGPVLLFAHGYGCDQNMWRYVTPYFQSTHRIVLFDYVGAGGADLASYELAKYSSLDGYASDIIEICKALDLHDVTFVGHSVSSMIGALADVAEPGLFSKLVFVAPSPCYINDEGYVGGFEATDIDELLTSLESNYLGWSSAMAPAIMGNPDRPELGEELTESFCRTDPEVAKRFARVTFLTDLRDLLPKVLTPTLVLQCSNDAIAPVSVGEFVRDQLPSSEFVLLNATGHCPNLSAPKETAEAIAAFVDA